MNQTINGNSNLSKYWTNDAYTLTSNVSNHEKIFFSTGDHSAITTATSGKVRSKWGRLPLYEHSTAQCPYSSGNLQYYKLVNPTVSGSFEALCNNSQRTFSESSFTNISLNYDWSVTAPVAEVSGDGTSSYTVAGSAQSGSAFLTLTITTPSGATATSYKSLKVGAPLLSYITDPGGGSNPFNFYAMPSSDYSTTDTYTWTVTPYGYADIYSWFDHAEITFTEPMSYRIDVEATNACGCSQAYKYFNYYGDYLMSPNPASTEVEITISTGEAEGSKSVSPSSDDAYTVTVLDIYGSVKIQKKYSGNKFTIPVSSLKDGNYIVKVNNKKINLTKQLIVKH